MSVAGITRREALRRVGLAGAAVVAAPMVNLGRYRLFAGIPTEYSARAVKLVTESLVIDMLGPMQLADSIERKWFGTPDGFTAADFQRFRDSQINVFHIAVGIGGRQAYESVLLFVAAWNSFIAAHPEWLVRIDQAGDLDTVLGSGHVGVLIGLQDSDHFRRPEDVDLFHSLGQRVSQLTYNSRNLIGNGSTERVDGGVSDFGAAIIARMNQVGMAVDVSHSGDRTTLDALDLSKRAVLFTHSNCRALNPGHPRCKTDEAIRKMAAQGGVMGITAVRMFVKATEPTTIEDLLDHYDHVRDLVGPEHLGIGTDSDLDGYDRMPADENKRLRAGYKGSYGFRDRIDIDGMNHPKKVFDLTEGLIRRKYSDADIRAILGGNFKRALTEIWAGMPAPETASGTGSGQAGS